MLGADSALRSHLGEAQGGGLLARHIGGCRVALMEAVGAEAYAAYDRAGRLRNSTEALLFARGCLDEAAALSC